MTRNDDDEAALRRLCALAGGQATAAPVLLQVRRPWRRTALVLASAAGLLALAAAAAQWIADAGSPAAVPEPPPRPAVQRAPAAAPADDAVVPRVFGLPATAPPTAADDAVRWEGGQLALDFEQVALPEAVAALAAATRTTVGGHPLPVRALPVSLHRQVDDVAAAWQALLHRRVRHSLACDAAGCRLRIDGPWDAAAATAPDAAREEAESQPGGSC